MYHPMEFENLPKRAAMMLDKVRTCIDFGSEEPPIFFEFWGENNTKAIPSKGELLGILDVEDLERVLTTIALNQNIQAMAFTLPAREIIIDGRSTGLASIQDVQKYIESGQEYESNHVLFCAYETRTESTLMKAVIHFDEATGIDENSELAGWECTTTSLSDIGSDIPNLGCIFLKADRMRAKLS